MTFADLLSCMHWLDWLILLGTLGFIVGYGVWRTRRSGNSNEYLRGGNDSRWWAVGLSVMATQASAITFLSTTGLGYLEGIGFVQFYFGLPLAMLVINRVFIPLYYKWNVFTAYEFIGKRFDGRARMLTAVLFLVQRSLAAGFTIYAPSIILSKVLHWPLAWTCVFIGALVILYTATGGARAVGVTHKQQMAVIFGGLFVVFGMIVWLLRDTISFGESMRLANDLGKLDAIDTSFNPSNRYTLWSGLIGGFFLQLAYFGTDQSQVQRYLSGQNVAQAKRGLWMNALLKIPMQFFILLIGVMVFVFYLFNTAPVHWNSANMVEMAAEAQGRGGIQELNRAPGPSPGVTAKAERARDAAELQAQHAENATTMTNAAISWVAAQRSFKDGSLIVAERELSTALFEDSALREAYRAEVKATLPAAEANDQDYIFITFIMDHMPIGVIGLLLAMIFSAGMSSTSAELSALATTSIVDVVRKERTDGQQVRATKLATVGFGLLALAFAALFPLFENLIQAVNIIGSLFYGTLLGVFLVAFFLKRIGGTAVFVAALITQVLTLLHFALDQWDVCATDRGDPLELAFLWYNLLSPAFLILLAILLQSTIHSNASTKPKASGV